MDPNSEMPGILFDALARARRRAIERELARRVEGRVSGHPAGGPADVRGLFPGGAGPAGRLPAPDALRAAAGGRAQMPPGRRSGMR